MTDIAKMQASIERLGQQPGLSAPVVELMGSDQKAAITVCHQLALNAGWWHDLETGESIERDPGEVFTLIHSEISEGFEGWRKNLMDDKLPHRQMLEVELADALIRIFDAAGGFSWELPLGSSPSEMSVGNRFAGIHAWITCAYTTVFHSSQPDVDAYETGEALGEAVAQINGLAALFGYDLYAAMVEKLVFNLDREDHKREARLAKNGKKI